MLVELWWCSTEHHGHAYGCPRIVTDENRGLLEYPTARVWQDKRDQEKQKWITVCLCFSCSLLSFDILHNGKRLQKLHSCFDTKQLRHDITDRGNLLPPPKIPQHHTCTSWASQWSLMYGTVPWYEQLHNKYHVEITSPPCFDLFSSQSWYCKNHPQCGCWHAVLQLRSDFHVTVQWKSHR